MIEYGFFNAVNGDRTYNADSFNEFFNGILTETGVYKKSGDALKVIPYSGMKVAIGTGKARINSHWVNVPNVEAVTLTESDLTLNRYDAIVLRYNSEERSINLMTIEGTAATSPNKPSIMRTASTYDICLAYVYVPAGATSITVSNITDTRDDTDVCGYVKLQIDAINAGIKQYRNVVDITSEVTQITIGIPQYDSANDLLFANINGVMFVEGEDYTVSGTGSSAKIVLNTSIKADNVVEFRVIKSVIEVL